MKTLSPSSDCLVAVSIRHTDRSSRFPPKVLLGFSSALRFDANRAILEGWRSGNNPVGPILPTRRGYVANSKLPRYGLLGDRAARYPRVRNPKGPKRDLNEAEAADAYACGPFGIDGRQPRQFLNRGIVRSQRGLCDPSPKADDRVGRVPAGEAASTPKPNHAVTSRKITGLF
jgi:hypothetical protein